MEFHSLFQSAHKQSLVELCMIVSCELPGYILNQENNKTTCNKDELEKYSYSNLSYVSTIFTFALLPLVILLYMITWQHCMKSMKWMKVLFPIQQKNNFKFVKAKEPE